MSPDELDALFREVKERQPALPAALQARMLEDALSAMPAPAPYASTADAASRPPARPATWAGIAAWLARLLPPPAARGSLLAASLLTLAILPRIETASTGPSIASAHANAQIYAQTRAEAAASLSVDVAWDEDLDFSLWLMGWTEEALLESSSEETNSSLDTNPGAEGPAQ